MVERVLDAILEVVGTERRKAFVCVPIPARLMRQLSSCYDE